MNLQQARFNMVEQQIRPWEVLYSVVLDLLEGSPRDEYVPQSYAKLAYADIAVPLDDGQVMMPPRVEARLLQSLSLEPADKALEVGTGSGYLTSLLASLCEHVVSVEISQTLAAQAAQKLKAHGYSNVTLERGDAVRGWKQKAPYDAIAVTGSTPIFEYEFQAQLNVGGRLFIIVGEAPAMEALLIRRTGESQWITESLFETVIPALEGAPQPDRFVL
jgi:protein-L-isoaspartate(D-aspartate) O-methyltransferase